MREELTALAERRKGKGGRKLTVVRAPDEAEDEPKFHTTFHVSMPQRKALLTEATRRVTEEITTRHDKSAVLRDVLDWWLANPDAFAEWMRRRRQE